MCNSCVFVSLPFVCTERHSREHQLHTSPLPALEPLLSSKRDPYKALLLHKTLDPPETAAPVVLKHKRQNMFTTNPCSNWRCRQRGLQVYKLTANGGKFVFIRFLQLCIFPLSPELPYFQPFLWFQRGWQ